MSFVYFICDGDHVKIGWSKDPEARLAQLQTGNPNPLELLGVFAGTETDERAMHAAFGPWAVLARARRAPWRAAGGWPSRRGARST